MVAVKFLYAAALLSMTVVAQNNNGQNGNVANAGANGQANNGKNAQQANGQANQGQQQGQQQNNANNGQNNGANANANNNGNNANGAAAAASASAAAAAASNNANANANNNNNNNNNGNNANGAAASASAAAAAASNNANANANNNNNNNNNNGNNNAATGTQGNAADSTTLQPNAIQSGSFFDGSQGLGAEAGQAVSQTSQNNFINFCAGQTLTNGLQITDGSCNGIVMGQIPSKNQMISSILTFPQNGQTIQAGQDFNITVQVQNLQAGSFTNADATYYSAPQQLQGGVIVGHTHITVQDLGNSLNPTTPPDPTQFAFFKGINDAGNGKGTLAATVAGGLPAGNFRVCTLTSASNHQPVIMPVAQRGSQDDCTKFTVSGNGGTTNEAANNGDKGQAAAALAQSAVDLGAGALTTAAAGAAATGAANNNNNNNGQNNNANNGKGQGGKNKRLARLARRSFVA